ncbi:MAG TPA: lipopolysaccharide heptosyltransferase II [Verrucomicrobiae bacterium]|nr:lipopolysaccharide heptosyltransferase II [Verrucomicrobiae bacterium]
MKRLLVRGTNWLGDAVMTTPALMRLREKFPGAHIALITPEKLGQLWLHHPAVDEVISFSAGQGVFSVAGKLRKGKFDVALVLPNSPRSAMEVFFAMIPSRIGYARPWRNFFLTQTVAPRPGAVKMRKRPVSEVKALIDSSPQARIRTAPILASVHQAHEYLHLAAAVGASAEPFPATLHVTPDEVTTARQKFGLAAVSNPIFGLNPGAEYGPAKRWPIERFIAAAKEIQKRTNCVWILFGANSDVEMTNQIESALLPGGPAVFNVAGKTSLRELMSLMKLCRVFLTNDTGPMHLAAALGVPVVAIFGSTSPELTAPLPASESRLQILASDTPCSPCFLRECPIDFRCMNGIGIKAVVVAVLRLVQDGKNVKV